MYGLSSRHSPPPDPPRHSTFSVPSPFLFSSHKCTCRALLRTSVICRKWTRGFVAQPACGCAGGVSYLFSLLSSKLSIWKPVQLLMDS